jgi:hypothetical protein
MAADAKECGMANEILDGKPPNTGGTPTPNEKLENN